MGDNKKDAFDRQDLARWPLEWIAFLLTVGFALALRWEAKDLIWGLWISSLTVGYAFIIRVIVGGIMARPPIIPLPVALAAGAFLLAFFTFHFGMFHFVHSVFLDHFFPILPAQKGRLPNMLLFMGAALKAYWPVVLANLLVKLPDFRDVHFDLAKVQDLMTRPYVTVIRIHILIFVLAGMSFVHAERLMIYPILALFFFPIEKIFLRNRTGLGG